MSWPDDGKPRFQVISVTGWVITAQASGAGGSGHHQQVPQICGVVDRAYAHRLVREYVPTRQKWIASCRERAETAARELNERDAADDLVMT